MHKDLFGNQVLDDVDNLVAGARVFGAAVYALGGCMHIPAIKAVATSDLKGGWKYLAIATLGGNAFICFKNGAVEMLKIAEIYDPPKEGDETEETDGTAEADPAEEEEGDKVVEFTPPVEEK